MKFSEIFFFSRDSLMSNSGKISGNSLITLEDELTVQIAFKTKNLSHISKKYILISQY